MQSPVASQYCSRVRAGKYKEDRGHRNFKHHFSPIGNLSLSRSPAEQSIA